MEKEQTYLTGTTTVGLTCKDGVVFAADTRAMMGYLVASKMAPKIHKITEKIAATTAGSVADTQTLVNILRAEAGYFHMREGVPMDVRAAARLAANILHAQPIYPYIVNMLVGGIDAGGPRLYFIDLDGTLTEETIAATGSGSPIAYGVLESQFSDETGVEKSLPIVVQALKSAMKRDIATGNELEIVTITPAGYRQIPPKQIKKLA